MVVERRMLSRGATAAIFLVATSSVANADAELQLQWIAPTECPSQAEIAARVLDIVGPNARPRQVVDAKVSVSRSDADWLAEIHLKGSTRTVQGESCAALGDAVAVIVALAVEHDASPSSAPEYEKKPEKEKRPAESSPSANVLFVGVAMGIGAGTLPAADVGPAIVAGWNAGRFRLGVDLGLTAKVEGRTAERPSEGATFWLARGGARACYTFLEGAFVVGPCAGIEADRIAANGFGSPQPKNTSAIVPIGFTGVLALIRVSSPLFVRATLDGAVPLDRPSFSVEGTGPVHRVSAVGLRGAAGLEMHF